MTAAAVRSSTEESGIELGDDCDEDQQVSRISGGSDDGDMGGTCFGDSHGDHDSRGDHDTMMDEMDGVMLHDLTPGTAA